MKKIPLLLSVLLTVSCSGFLEERVYSQLTPENAYDTPEGANKAMTACYSWLRHSFDNKWSAGFGELGTDEATSYNDIWGDHESQLDDYTYTAEYDWIDAVYGSCYAGIKCCNIVKNTLFCKDYQPNMHVFQKKCLTCTQISCITINNLSQ